jgi:EmrB/QacA subfamily drug resistance transporter
MTAAVSSALIPFDRESRSFRLRWWILAVLCLSLLVIVVDNSILNVALPHLQEDLNATFSQLQWMVDSYTLVFACLLLTAGSLGDRFGRKGALQFGMAVFGLGSVLSAMANSPEQLIATRALMGVGGAFIMPSTLSLITNVFPPEERGRAISYWAAIAGVGVALGPVSGGLLLEHFYWGSIFLVNIPIVATALIAGAYLLPKSRDPEKPKLDLIGAALSIVGLLALVYAIIQGPTEGWTSPVIVGSFTLAVVVLAVFAWWESHSTHPMLRLSVFENPRFSAASLGITLIFFAMFGTLFLLTQYLQSVLGYSTVKAGAVLLPQAAVLMIFAPLSNVWVQRFGSKVVVTTGLLIVTASLVAFSAFEPDSSVLLVIAVTALLGLGMANVLAPCTDSIMGSLPRAKAGVGSAVNDTTRQFGGAVGVAVFGSLVASRFADQMGTRLSGTVPAAVLGQARESIGSAFEAVRNAPSGNLFADQIIGAARISFVDAMHTAMLLAMCMLLVAAAIVAKFLPARARDDDLGPAAVEAAPVGAGPVDVIPAGLAPDLADITDSP